MAAKKDRTSSTHRTWSRPDDQDRFHRSPIALDHGAVVVSDAWLADSAVLWASDVAGDDDVFYAALSVIFLVYDPGSLIYRNLPLSERKAKTLARFDAKKLKKIESFLESKDFDDLKKDYLSVVRTPSERMLASFEDQVHAFVEETNNMEVGGDGKKLIERIKHGKQLLVDLDDLAAYVRKESGSSTRAGYKTALFERRETAQHVRQ